MENFILYHAKISRNTIAWLIVTRDAGTTGAAGAVAPVAFLHLSTRSKVARCMPNAMRNQRAVKEMTKAFLEKHKKPVISGIKKTSYSQTLDRLAKEDNS